MLTDPIADMFIQIKNGLANKNISVTIPVSKTKQEILRILKDANYIEDFSEENKDKRKSLLIKLKYTDKKPTITHLKRISKPGLRIYAGWRNIPNPLGGLGLAIVSTPQGIISGKDAKKKRIGGEVICEVY